MTKKNVIKEIEKLGGVIGLDSETKVRGYINGYQVEWQSNMADVMTLQKLSQINFYDFGSDYNPGGYIFIRKIKYLGDYAK